MSTTTGYLAIKEHISNNLKKIDGTLPESKITEEVNNTKSVISQIGYEMFAKVISVESLSEMEEDDWKRIIRELETHFDVKMEAGILIQGSEQQERDNTWWTGVEKQKNKKYYWERYKSHISSFLPAGVVKTIDDDTDIVMNNIENPIITNFSRYGMVVGHVQSGKTGNYSGLVCKAADAGYKFIVVIAGGMNNLRNQTQERLNEAFVGQTNGVQVGAGKGDSNKNLTPYSLTTVLRDFNKHDADRASQGINFETINVPILIVIKKNTSTLKSVISWLEKQYKNKVADHAMLVIDDESDYASVNTKEEEDPTAINGGIRRLLSLFSRSAYVAYTATPYANIFIDHEAENDAVGRDLFPKDFIYALDAPTNYFGARKIFLDTDGKHLIEVTDFGDDLPTGHNKDLEVTSIPESLKEAIQVFLLNIAVRNLRGYANSHNSMLVHATRFTAVHQKIAVVITKYIEEVQEDVTAFGKLHDAKKQSDYIASLGDSFDKYFKDDEFSWQEIIDILTDVISTVVIREVHQKTTVPLEYRKDIATNAIVIGGTSLARGYTLEGLSVSYFLRNTVFYDTLMQMGRWFGYRSGYEDLCKIYMPYEKIVDFAEIISATEELLADFQLMADNNMTPEKFGLAIRQNPNSALQITARNKQKNVTDFNYSMRLDGKAKETSVLSSKLDEISANIEAIKGLVDNLPAEFEKINNHFLWKDINRGLVLNFLKTFITFQNDPLGLTARMPISFIKKYVEERNINWDIALYSGQGEIFPLNSTISLRKEKRKIITKTDNNYELQNRQVSSGNAESISLGEIERKVVGTNRIEARRIMSRPLLMLHIIEPNPEISTIANNALAAFGASFPGDVLSDAETITLKINTVYYNNLLKEVESDNESDD
ncbi:Z1 domain-containing protein [Flavobacterium macrobrachii]|uniref:Z1 domain-containing protein n=1 Tax=Flavobacterium macrobrachii TaxID=591204 RepID=A0ABS2CVZ4_9FLAO|nr:Z1 domain-containing protein [Flavobacterium macrobrachii]MBM6498355.1 Z1 domain-containing protein [Flavobacterium macrobrachii]